MSRSRPLGWITSRCSRKVDRRERLKSSASDFALGNSKKTAAEFWKNTQPLFIVSKNKRKKIWQLSVPDLKLRLGTIQTNNAPLCPNSRVIVAWHGNKKCNYLGFNNYAQTLCKVVKYSSFNKSIQKQTKSQWCRDVFKFFSSQARKKFVKNYRVSCLGTQLQRRYGHVHITANFSAIKKLSKNKMNSLL